MFYKYKIHYLSLVLLLSACAKQEKRPTDMNYDELKNYTTTSSIDNNKLEALTMALETIVKKYPDHIDAQKYRLMLGNLYFETKRYKEADKCYTHFFRLNPAEGDYAAYRSIQCKFYQTLGIHRDQNKVKNTLQAAKGFLSAPIYKSSQYTKQVKDIIYTCEKICVDHEIYVIGFYIKRGQYKSAENRVKDFRKRLLDQHKDVEPHLLYLESKLAHHKRDKAAAIEKGNLLLTKFPKSEYAALADKMLNKKNDFIFF